MVESGSGYVKMKRTSVEGTVEARQWTLGMDAQGMVDIGPWNKAITDLETVTDVAGREGEWSVIDMPAGGARMMRRNRLGILSAGTVTSWNWHVDNGIADVLECNGDRNLGFGMPEGVVDSGVMSDGMR